MRGKECFVPLPVLLIVQSLKQTSEGYLHEQYYVIYNVRGSEVMKSFMNFQDVPRFRIAAYVRSTTDTCRVKNGLQNEVE